jgi:hypothetical protein
MIFHVPSIWISAQLLGNARAQCKLGDLYRDGNGLAKNPIKAAFWYRKAADQGDYLGLCEVGFCYYEGIGNEVNYEQAVSWWRKAAEKGDPVSQYRLSLCYSEGTGVPKDEIEAYAYLHLPEVLAFGWAISDHDGGRGEQHGSKERTKLESIMTQAQISAGLKRAGELDREFIEKRSL